MTAHDRVLHGWRPVCIAWLVAWTVAVPSARASEAAPSAGPIASATSAVGEWRRDSDLPDRSHVIRAAAAVVLTLAVGTVWLVSKKRRGRPVGPGWIRFTSRVTGSGRGASDGAVVRQSIRLGSVTTMHVVAWGGREWLIGCSTGGLTVIGEQPARNNGAATPAGGEAQL